MARARAMAKIRARSMAGLESGQWLGQGQVNSWLGSGQWLG